jgi:hypothetical protein
MHVHSGYGASQVDGLPVGSPSLHGELPSLFDGFIVAPKTLFFNTLNNVAK